MSRETRQLLVTALVAVVALWVLARIRFPDQSSTANPVPALLTQFAPRASLSDLAFESSQLRARLGTSVLALSESAAALRIREDTAVALFSPDAGVEKQAAHVRAAREDGDTDQPEVMAVDRATGMTLLRVGAAAAALATAPWAPEQLNQPRYLLASVPAGGDVALRPTFVASLEPVTDAAWPGAIWRVPQGTDLPVGALVFTTDAELAGMVVPHLDRVAIVPGRTLLAEANRLLARPARPAGTLGVDVQPLTPAVALATGARTGVILTWLDADGPAARQLMVGDVIEAADGQWLETRRHWDVRVARLAPGDRIVLGVRRRWEWLDIQLVAAPPGDPESPRPLGLTLRTTPGIGSEVLRVERGSAGDAAGVRPGDVVTLVGTTAAPTPAEIRNAYAGAPPGKPLLVATTRDRSSRVTTFVP